MAEKWFEFCELPFILFFIQKYNEGTVILTYGRSLVTFARQVPTWRAFLITINPMTFPIIVRKLLLRRRNGDKEHWSTRISPTYTKKGKSILFGYWAIIRKLRLIFLELTPETLYFKDSDAMILIVLMRLSLSRDAQLNIAAEPVIDNGNLY